MNSSDNMFQSYVGFSSPPTCLLRPEVVPAEGRESLRVTSQGDKQQEQKKKKAPAAKKKGLCVLILFLFT